MKTTLEHNFVLNDIVYVMNNDCAIQKGKVIGIYFEVHQYDENSTIFTDICYKVKTKYKESVYRQQQTFATAEAAFSA